MKNVVAWRIIPPIGFWIKVAILSAVTILCSWNLFQRLNLLIRLQSSAREGQLNMSLFTSCALNYQFFPFNIRFLQLLDELRFSPDFDSLNAICLSVCTDVGCAAGSVTMRRWCLKDTTISNRGRSPRWGMALLESLAWKAIPFLILSLKPKESIAKKGSPLNKRLLQIGQLQAKRPHPPRFVTQSACKAEDICQKKPPSVPTKNRQVYQQKTAKCTNEKSLSCWKLKKYVYFCSVKIVMKNEWIFESNRWPNFDG